MVALRNGQFHFISIRRDQQRKRLHGARQDCAVIEYIRTAAFRQGEPADIGNEKAVLEHKISRDLLCRLHFLCERHVCLMQRFTAVCGGFCTIEQLFALHLILQKRLRAPEHLVIRQIAVFRKIRQIDKANKIPRGKRRQQRTQIDRNLRDNRLVRSAELIIKRFHHQRSQYRQRTDADGLCVIVQLRKRERHLGDDLGAVSAPLYLGGMNSLRLFPDAIRRKFTVCQLLVAVCALLGRPAGIHAAHRAVILNRETAVFQVLEQYTADKLLESASIRDRVLILHIDGLVVVADEK